MLKKINSNILSKITITFILVMIIPIILVSVYLNRLITDNIDEKIKERLLYGKKYILSEIKNNSLKLRTQSIKLIDDQRLWKYIYLTNKKTGHIDKSLFLELMAEYNISFVSIYNKNLEKVFHISYDFFDNKYSQIPLEHLKKGVKDISLREYLTDEGLLIHSVSPAREYSQKDIEIGKVTNVIVKGMLTKKDFLENLRNVMGLEFSLLNIDSKPTNILSTFSDNYGLNLSGKEIKDKFVIKTINQITKSSKDFYLDSQEITNKIYKSLYFPIITSDGRMYIGSVYQETKIFDTGYVQLYLLILTVIMLFLIVVASLFISRGIINPLNALLNGIKRLTFQIENNKPFEKIEVTSHDEIYKLSAAFNKMAKRLTESFSETRIAKNYLTNIIESIPSILITIDNNNLITHWNRAAIETSAITLDKASGKNLFDLLPELKKYEEYFELIKKSKQKIEFHREPFKSNGNIQYRNITLFHLKGIEIVGVGIRIEDVTDIEKKDAQLRQAQKMDTVGTLAGGLAHDFNNVLGGILGTLSILKFKLSKEPKINIATINEHITLMEDSGERAKDMVTQLLSISKKQELNFACVSLNKVVEDVVKICKNSLDKCIEIVPAYAENNAFVNADITQIEQVLLNLCVNASHAMTIMRENKEQMGGILSISLEKIFADELFCQINPDATEGYYWILSVSDTGVGMVSKTISEIFSPFFTTKSEGKGTGLGLSMVYSILKQHKGFIDVKSEVGLGSTFNIFLPENTKKRELRKTPIKDQVKKGKGTILIVDDELIIRMIAKQILEECNYKVILSLDGEDGVKMFKKHHKEIDAILLDMVMPKKSGIIAYKEMSEIDKNLKVLLASGFRRDERVEDLLKAGVKDFIQKPYTLGKLSEKIYEVVNS